jgi:LmbE family N-acetylglucosaminyl deacetylase
MTITVLAIYAHPDDEVLAAGGTLARYARLGHRVHVAILGEGVTSRFATRQEGLASAGAQEELRKLHSTIAEASRILGAVRSWPYQLPDNRFDSVDLLSVIKIVEGLKEEVRPSVVLTHHPGDMNVDHGIVTNAVLTAFRSLPGEAPCQILAGEVLSSTDYSIGVAGRAFEPNVWVPLEATDVHKKKQALEAYAGEIRPFPHPRSVEAIEHLARLRGCQSGAAFAEAFRLLRGWGGMPGCGA